MQWALVFGVRYDGVTVESPPLLIQKLNSGGPFAWEGSFLAPVVALEGFQEVGDELLFIVRLQPYEEDDQIGERVSVLQEKVETSRLNFTTSSPRK